MSFLSMSDEQIMAMGGVAPEVKPAVEETPNVEQTEEQKPAADVNAQPQEADAGAGDESLQEPASTAVDAETEVDAEAEAAAAREDAGAQASDEHRADEADAGTGPAVKPAVKQEPATSLPEGAERIFESFRANGRDMQVKSVDEAIRLMQMGANYSQKRQQDKQKLGFVKVLEQNGLLDHEKLSFLVDLASKKPEAIAKLVKDANFDVHEIDEAKVAAYKAQSLAPTDAQLDLDDVIADIKGSKSFDRLVGDMKTWDSQSQAMLGNHPAALRQLAQQMDNGVYDTIMNEVNRRQVLGELEGTPVMQAYNQIGQEMAAAGQLGSKPAPKVPAKKLVTPGKKAPAPNAEVEAQRRAAAPSKGASTEVAPQKIDFLNMKDEDFAKYIKQ